MNLAALRQATRDLVREQSSDAGTLFVTGDVLLDFFLNMACQNVIIDLAGDTPELFLIAEAKNMVSGAQTIALTYELLQIWDVKRNVTNQTPQQIPYYPIFDVDLITNVGETGADPEGYTLQGSTIYFWPTPNRSVTSYFKIYYLTTEPALAAGGPTYLPPISHYLIPFKAAQLIGEMLEADWAVRWSAIYERYREKISDTFHFRIQHQPRFIGRSVYERTVSDTRDKVLYDRIGLLD